METSRVMVDGATIIFIEHDREPRFDKLVILLLFHS